MPTTAVKIDATAAGAHRFLAPTDECYYLWDYGRLPDGRPASGNMLIRNLKRKPSCVAGCEELELHKQRAIGQAARALRAGIDRRWLETSVTVVPMPGSKVVGHPDHDDRLLRVMQIACLGYAADIRCLLTQVGNTQADHEAAARQTMQKLLAIIRVDDAVVRPVRRCVLLFDDVLTSGRHFKVAQALLRERFPQVRIVGLFLARSLPSLRVHGGGVSRTA